MASRLSRARADPPRMNEHELVRCQSWPPLYQDRRVAAAAAGRQRIETIVKLNTENCANVLMCGHFEYSMSNLDLKQAVAHI